jgi:hypothetical protein
MERINILVLTGEIRLDGDCIVPETTNIGARATKSN